MYFNLFNRVRAQLEGACDPRNSLNSFLGAGKAPKGVSYPPTVSYR